MSTDLVAQLAALPPIEIAGLVVDIALLFHPVEPSVPPRSHSDLPASVRGLSLSLVASTCFAAALSRHRERLGLSCDDVFAVSITFAEVFERVFGVPSDLVEQQIGGAR